MMEFSYYFFDVRKHSSVYKIYFSIGLVFNIVNYWKSVNTKIVDELFKVCFYRFYGF